MYLEEANLEMGYDRERWVKTRLNQHRFRNWVMTNYDFTCCITGIRLPSLLIASHITRWSDDHSPNPDFLAIHNNYFKECKSLSINNLFYNLFLFNILIGFLG